MRIVIVDSDGEHRRALERMLAAMPSVAVVGEFAHISTAVVDVASNRPDVVIVEAPEAHGEDRAILALEQLAHALSDTPIVAVGPTGSAAFVIRVMRAGAVEYLGRPVEPAELTAVLEKVARFRHHAAPARLSGSIVSVFATKGGLGATTVATNLAVALAQASAGETLLVEVDTRHSDVATFLNLRPAYSIVDAVRNIERMDESFLRGLLTRHESGLWVLTAPTRVETGGMPADHVRAALGIIRSHFHHVVLDLRHDWDPATVAALGASNETLVLTSLNVAALRSAAAAVAAFRELAIDRAHVRLVLMREGAPEDVTVDQARTLLGIPVSWKVPNDYPVAVAAINCGRPLITEAPRSKLAKNLTRLAVTVARTPRAAAVSAAAPRARPLLRHAWRARLLGAF